MTILVELVRGILGEPIGVRLRNLVVLAELLVEGVGAHDAASGAKIHSIKLDWNNAAPLAITPDGRLLSSGGAGEDGEYVSSKAWELRTGRELKTLQVLFNAFSADGRWGASLEFRQCGALRIPKIRVVSLSIAEGIESSDQRTLYRVNSVRTDANPRLAGGACEA